MAVSAVVGTGALIFAEGIHEVSKLGFKGIESLFEKANNEQSTFKRVMYKTAGVALSSFFLALAPLALIGCMVGGSLLGGAFATAIGIDGLLFAAIGSLGFSVRMISNYANTLFNKSLQPVQE